MRCTIRDHFPVGAETYWRELFFSRDFLTQMYREALACERLEFVREERAPELTRTMRFTQRVDASAPVRRLFGDTATMQEDGRFDAARGRWCWQVRPDRMSDRVQITGETWLEPAAGGVERVCQMEVVASMFGLGGLVEYYVTRSTTRSYARQTEFARGYIAARGLGAQPPEASPDCRK